MPATYTGSRTPARLADEMENVNCCTQLLKFSFLTLMVLSAVTVLDVTSC